jgi:hypothetical protein
MTSRPSLKALVATAKPEMAPAPASIPEPAPAAPASRVARTRINSRQVSAHFAPEVVQTLRLIAAEQDREQQDLMAEALNMLFERYGKPALAKVLGTRRARLPN